MRVVAAVLATMVAGTIMFVQPWAGRRRYQRLLAALGHDRRARLRHYRRGIVTEWAGVAVIGVVGLLAGRSPASIGLERGPHATAAEHTVLGVSVVLGISALIFRFGGERVRRVLKRQTRGFEALLPRRGREQLTFAMLAVTAGICEEVLFRGFGIAYVRWLWPGASHTALNVLTSASFGLAHLYQGLRGVVLTGLVGAYLAWLVLSTGSLLPAMILHALLDLRILAIPDLTDSYNSC